MTNTVSHQSPAVKRISREVAARRAQETYAAGERWRAVEAGTETTRTTPAMLAVLNTIERHGDIDRLAAGPFRMYEGGVGEDGEGFTAQVVTLGGGHCEAEYVLRFWSRGDGRARRLLILASGEMWLHTEGETIFPHTGKYARAADTILSLRAEERATGVLSC